MKKTVVLYTGSCSIHRPILMSVACQVLLDFPKLGHSRGRSPYSITKKNGHLSIGHIFVNCWYTAT